MKKFTVIKESKGCIDGVQDRIMDGYVFAGSADYDESKRVDTDSFYDGWNGKICEDENGELYLVEFNWETNEPEIWCRIKRENSLKISTTKYNEVNPAELSALFSAGARLIKSSSPNGVCIGKFTQVDGKVVTAYSDDDVVIHNVTLPLSTEGCYDHYVLIN